MDGICLLTMLLLLFAVCGVTDGLSGPKSSERFGLNFSESQIDTYITIKGSRTPVFHMEMDQYVEGNVLFNHGLDLATTDGKRKDIVAKVKQEPWWRGPYTANPSITGFAQISRTKVILGNSGSSCIKLVDRQTNQSETFVGDCRESGSVGGRKAKFFNTRSIIRDSISKSKLLIVDQKNQAIRHLDIINRIVSTFFNGTQLKLGDIYALSQETESGDLYMTAKEQGIYHLSYYRNILTPITIGSSRQRLYDGLFNPPRDVLIDVLILDGGRRLLAVVENKYRTGPMIEINLQKSTIEGLCTIWELKSCSSIQPHSLMVSGAALYIGGKGKICKVTGLITTTAGPPTTTEPTVTTGLQTSSVAPPSSTEATTEVTVTTGLQTSSVAPPSSTETTTEATVTTGLQTSSVAPPSSTETTTEATVTRGLQTSSVGSPTSTETLGEPITSVAPPTANKTGDRPITTNDADVCQNRTIVRKLATGQESVEVEIRSGHILRLRAGDVDYLVSTATQHFCH